MCKIFFNLVSHTTAVFRVIKELWWTWRMVFPLFTAIDLTKCFLNWCRCWVKPQDGASVLWNTETMATYRLTDPQLYSLSDSLSGIIQYDINLTANAVTQYELSFSFLLLIFLSVLSQDDDLIRKACLEKKNLQSFSSCVNISACGNSSNGCMQKYWENGLRSYYRYIDR